MSRYYIVYHTAFGHSWRIVDTEFDLDTSSGLEAWIAERRELDTTPVCILNWKKLKNETEPYLRKEDT